MRGFYEMSIAVSPGASVINVNAELRSLADVEEFVTLFNAVNAEVFPAPETDVAAQVEGEDA